MKTTIVLILTLFTIQVNAQILGSLGFDGTDNYVEIADSPLNTIGTGDFTLEAWIRGDASEQTFHPMILSNRGENSTGGGIVLFFHDQWGGSQSKMLCFQVNGVNYFLINNGSFDGSLLDNKCHHMAITRSGNLISYYADGILFGTKTIPNSATINSGSPLWIGKDRATNNTFNGIISQCRVWNIARTQTEIFDNKDISLIGDEPGLVAYWEMDDANGQVVIDKTGQFDGRLGSEEEVDLQDPLWSSEGCIEIAPTATINVDAIPLTVYPNPTMDVITVQNPTDHNVALELIDQTGRLMLAKMVGNGSTEIDLSKYPSGVYFIHLIDKEVFRTEKIIKY